MEKILEVGKEKYKVSYSQCVIEKHYNTTIQRGNLIFGISLNKEGQAHYPIKVERI